MQICIYEWALHTLGGGQKVSMKIAEILSRKHDVTILSLFPVDKKAYEKAFSLNLSRVEMQHIYPEGLEKAGKLHLLSFKKVSEISKNYDVFINTEAHETVKPLAKRNIMICHFPELKWYRKPHGLLDGARLIVYFLMRSFLGNYSAEYEIYCSSNHSQEWVKENWKVKAKRLVLYSDLKIKKAKKQSIIVSVGRLTRDKKYDFMIECFKQLVDTGIKDYAYHICSFPSDKGYLKELEELGRKYPVRIHLGLDSKSIINIYSKSKIFFHAKGIDVDENKNLQDIEHFGLVTLESMSFGAVPVVPNRAGQREIIEHGKNGFFYEGKQEAIEHLKKLIRNPKLWQIMSKNASRRAKDFSLANFESQVFKMIGSS